MTKAFLLPPAGAVLGVGREVAFECMGTNVIEPRGPWALKGQDGGLSSPGSM